MDTLGDLSDDTSDSDSGAAEDPSTTKKRKTSQATVPDPETLQELGFQTPSVLLVPEKPDEGQQTWDW